MSHHFTASSAPSLSASEAMAPTLHSGPQGPVPSGSGAMTTPWEASPKHLNTTPRRSPPWSSATAFRFSLTHGTKEVSQAEVSAQLGILPHQLGLLLALESTAQPPLPQQRLTLAWALLLHMSLQSVKATSFARVKDRTAAVGSPLCLPAQTPKPRLQ